MQRMLDLTKKTDLRLAFRLACSNLPSVIDHLPSTVTSAQRSTKREANSMVAVYNRDIIYQQGFSYSRDAVHGADRPDGELATTEIRLGQRNPVFFRSILLPWHADQSHHEDTMRLHVYDVQTGAARNEGAMSLLGYCDVSLPKLIKLVKQRYLWRQKQMQLLELGSLGSPHVIQKKNCHELVERDDELAWAPAYETYIHGSKQQMESKWVSVHFQLRHFHNELADEKLQQSRSRLQMRCRLFDYVSPEDELKRSEAHLQLAAGKSVRSPGKAKRDKQAAAIAASATTATQPAPTSSAGAAATAAAPPPTATSDQTSESISNPAAKQPQTQQPQLNQQAQMQPRQEAEGAILTFPARADEVQYNDSSSDSDDSENSNSASDSEVDFHSLNLDGRLTTQLAPTFHLTKSQRKQRRAEARAEARAAADEIAVAPQENVLSMSSMADVVAATQGEKRAVSFGQKLLGRARSKIQEKQNNLK